MFLSLDRSCGKDRSYFKYQNKCYKLIVSDRDLSNVDSEKLCKRNNMSLLHLSSVPEIEMIKNVISSEFLDKFRVLNIVPLSKDSLILIERVYLARHFQNRCHKRSKRGKNI